FRPAAYGNIRHVLLLALLMVALAAAAAVVARTSLAVELIPIAFPALVIAALWDGRMALNFALVMAVLLAGQAPLVGVTALLTMALGGAAAALSVRVVRRRAQTWGFGALIALAYLAAAITMGLMRAHSFTEVFTSAGWGTANAVISAILAMGFLPLFEAFTRITTDQTLLELSDLNRPLLKRLALEAPGTYAHSINVANLAEAAARGIGANALLTRVGVYYHDVGKVVKPQYFVENQPHGRNPHDKLKPSTSATVVRGHVLEGLRLADEAKLPDPVKAFIAEHHGTQTISFFYEKAQEADPEAELNPRDFSYPGPRPQSKETAILMIADASESAARVLPDPTPDRIRDLVNRLVDARIAQGQLDEAPLTLRELSRIKDELVSVLSGVYHHRIDYPTMPMPAAERAPAAAGRGAGPG
ncbi:MAG TPA: HDIG domain-containing protein, partial [Longimicrobiales bacterium]|nr:HDIG domain-containing protein [Longimicrobiales bacterium]